MQPANLPQFLQVTRLPDGLFLAKFAAFKLSGEKSLLIAVDLSAIDFPFHRLRLTAGPPISIPEFIEFKFRHLYNLEDINRLNLKNMQFWVLYCTWYNLYTLWYRWNIESKFECVEIASCHQSITKNEIHSIFCLFWICSFQTWSLYNIYIHVFSWCWK